MQARRVVMAGMNTVEVQDVDVPAPGPREMLLEADCCLISAGTELATLRGAVAAGPRPGTARSLGYSFAGRVAATGAGVTEWQTGQRIAGHTSHSSAVVVPADRHFVAVPDDVTPEQASFVSLLAIALNAIRLAHIQIGEPVAILGQGLVGQLATQFARINGARPVVAVDALDTRLAIAQACGATHRINFRQVDDLSAAVRAATGGDGPRVVIEATGLPQPVNTALKIAGHGARVVLLGSTRGLVEQWDPYTDVHRKAITIIGAHSPSSHPPVGTFWNPWTTTVNMRVALDLIRDGSLNVDRLISHRYPAGEAPRAFAGLRDTPHDHLGVVLDWRK